MVSYLFEKKIIDKQHDVPVIILIFNESKIEFSINFDKSINSGFWGNVNIDIYDSDEMLVDINPVENITCYDCCSRHLAYNRKALNPGHYTAEISFSKEFNPNDNGKSFTEHRMMERVEFEI